MKKDLTFEFVKQFLENDELVDLSQFESISDDAAKLFENYDHYLTLDGLTSLSDNSARSLVKNLRGSLSLNGLINISDTTIKILASHKSTLCLHGVKTLSNIAAQALGDTKDTYR